MIIHVTITCPWLAPTSLVGLRLRWKEESSSWPGAGRGAATGRPAATVQVGVVGLLVT